MRPAALLAIRFYQRFISPHKGFCCAYRRHTGRASCSALGFRAVRRHGLRLGLALILERTRRCGDVHRHHHARRWRPPVAQRGDCDPGCVLPCDVSCEEPTGGFCGCADCCDCASCDWPGRREPRHRRRTGASRKPDPWISALAPAPNLHPFSPAAD